MARGRIYTTHRIYRSFAAAATAIPSCPAAAKELWYWIYTKQQLDTDSERIDTVSWGSGREEDADPVAREERQNATDITTWKGEQTIFGQVTQPIEKSPGCFKGGDSSVECQSHSDLQSARSGHSKSIDQLAHTLSSLVHRQAGC
jgi:hypothetical protein